MSDTQISTRAVAPIEMKMIPIGQIIVGHRYRQDLGEIDELVDSIRQNGLINPIAVSIVEDSYKLMAGGRRFEACRRLEYEAISCNVYPADLSSLERTVIELCENIDRKDMTFDEEANLKKRIHKAMQDLHGESKPGRSKAGHSMRDTARMLNKSIGAVQQDIRLADAMEILPELKDCKNKNEALKMLSKMEDEIINADLVKTLNKVKANTPNDKIKRAVADSYILGDFFDVVKEVEDNSIDLVELDPPFGIDLNSMKKQELSTSQTYTEWDREQYANKMIDVIGSCYRIMKENSWLICWFAIDPWFDSIAEVITTAGFSMNEIPALWIKHGGQCMQPDKYLANSYETFFYARKGNPGIQAQGRANYFRFKPVPPTRKISKAEKPVEMYDEIYRTFIKPGSKVFVPFAGSGNSLLSAYNHNCTASGADLTESSRDGYVLRALANMPGEYRSE